MFKKFVSAILTLLLTVLLFISVFSTESDNTFIVMRGTNEVLYKTEYVKKPTEEYYSHFVSPSEENDSSNSRSLPTSVDLSTSQFFPDHSLVQGNIGSCVAFSIVYFQFNYEVNRSLGLSASQADPYSPSWAYYHSLDYNQDTGVRVSDVYNFLATHGSLHLTDDPYTGVFDSNYQLFSSDDEDIVIDAMKTRISNYSLCTIPTSSHTISAPNDYTLNQVKSLLNNGYVLRASSAWNFNYANAGTLTNPKLTIYRCMQSMEGHSFVIVGYDDNFEYDVNNDGVIESAEKGAFKIVNSWDFAPDYLGLSNGTGVFDAWVLYDALNIQSAISGNWESNLTGTRCAVFDDKLDDYPNTNCFTWIDSINQYDGLYYIAKIDISDLYFVECIYKRLNGLKQMAAVSMPRRDVGDHTIYLDYNDASPYNGQWNYLNDGNISFSLPTDLSGANWGCALYFNSDYIDSGSVIDDRGNTIASMSLTYNAISNKKCYEAAIDLELGDLDYSGSLTNNDVTLLMSMSLNSSSASTLKKYLADMNGDGYINSRDVIILMGLIPS